MTLQDKILYCRKKQGLSQEALAEKIGVSRQAISKWETGEATPEVFKLSLLATTFNVTVDWLLSEEEPEEVREEKRKRENCNYKYGNDDYHKSDNNVNSIFERIINIVKKWSWLAGVYIAIFGLFVLVSGCGFRFIGNRIIGGFKDTSTLMFNSAMGDDYFNGGIIAEDEKTLEEMEDILPEIKDELGITDNYGNMFGNNMEGIIDASTSPMLTIINLLTGFAIAAGVIILVAGIVLAIYLKSIQNKGK